MTIDEPVSIEGRKARFERWEKLGIDRVRNDLQSDPFGLIGSSDIQSIAWDWIRLKEQAPLPLKRDMDLIRELLLKIEGGVTVFSTPLFDQSVSNNLVALNELECGCAAHLRLMQQGGLIEILAENCISGELIVRGLSWRGHDLLDSIRDPAVWAETKKAASRAGGFTVDLLKDLAKGFIKKQIEDLTGIKI